MHDKQKYVIFCTPVKKLLFLIFQIHSSNIAKAQLSNILSKNYDKQFWKNLGVLCMYEKLFVISQTKTKLRLAEFPELIKHLFMTTN